MCWNIHHHFKFQLLWLVCLTVAGTFFFLRGEWIWFGLIVSIWGYTFFRILQWDNRYARKIAFMFEAIENNDSAFQYAVKEHSSNDRLVSSSLNHITRIIFQAKAEAVQREKYYELIMNVVNTGIIVIDDNGVIFQTNNEALRLLGLSVFTHVKQLARIDEHIEKTIREIRAGDKQPLSFCNERGEVHLSVRVSEMTLQDKHVRILAINDINSELEEKEIDSWIRLTRVLTHEIMNSITPITSLSDSLLSQIQKKEDLYNGLKVISTTGKSLISFVESYRKFTHIPTPEPTLFYLKAFIERMVQLSLRQEYPNITLTTDIRPDELILYADENLISQILLNLLKNAMQAIGHNQPDGHIHIKAYSNREEAVLIEISNNGPLIPPEEMEHIFIPFFTTKIGGSGIGLSISRQIMRLSGGSITLKSSPATGLTTFILTFP